MPDWEVKIVTESGQIKNVRVDGYAFRPDAERAALSSSGAKKIVSSTPKDYRDAVVSQNTEHHYHEVPVYVDTHEEDYTSSLDELEEEMYDLMCQIALNEGKELPTVEEFYEWLEELDYD